MLLIVNNETVEDELLFIDSMVAMYYYLDALPAYHSGSTLSIPIPNPQASTHRLLHSDFAFLDAGHGLILQRRGLNTFGGLQCHRLKSPMKYEYIACTFI